MSENLTDPRQEHASKPAEEGLTLLGVAKKLGRWILAICGAGAIVLVALYYFLTFDLIRAARRGNYSAVAVAVAWSPDIVNQRVHGGGTLLYAAAAGDQVEIVEFLLESGADPNFPTRGGDRPVHAAAEAGNARAMKALAEGGADLNVPGGLFSEPPIMISAKKGHVEVVKVLLDAGVDPSTRVLKDGIDADTKFVYTTLSEAAREGHVEVVKLLLERGANLTYIENGDLTTDLHQFCAYVPDVSDERYKDWLRSMPTIVDLLVEKLGDVNFRDGLDFTGLHRAIDDDDSPGKMAIVRHLIEHYPDLDVNAAAILNYTPLHIAVLSGNVAGVKYLVENCPQLNVNATDQEGWTPLRDAERSAQFLNHKREESEYSRRRWVAMKQIIKLLKRTAGGWMKRQRWRRRDAERKRSRGAPERSKGISDWRFKPYSPGGGGVGTRSVPGFSLAVFIVCLSPQPMRDKPAHVITKAKSRLRIPAM